MKAYQIKKIINLKYGYYDYHGMIPYIDTQTKCKYLYLIFKTGIAKYNLTKKKIVIYYTAPQPIYTISKNDYCLDPIKGIIYIHIFFARKIISFNTSSKEWNFEFYKYLDLGIHRLLYGLCFFYSPINEVKFNITQYRFEFTHSERQRVLAPDCEYIMRIDKKNNIKMVQHNIVQQPTHLRTKLWYLEYIKLKLNMSSNNTINHIFDKLFYIGNDIEDRREFYNLLECSLVWDQIFFFVFLKSELSSLDNFMHPSIPKWSAIIDCVDLFVPNKVHRNIATLQLSTIDKQKISFYIQNNGILHHMDIKYQLHSEFNLLNILPPCIRKICKENRRIIIISICGYFQRISHSYLPKCLNSLIFKYCPMFT